MIGKIVVMVLLCGACFFAGQASITVPEPIILEMTPLEGCNQLIKSEAHGVYDPYVGIMFIRTYDREADQIEHTLLHELGHYYHGLDEVAAETFAINHKICGVDE